MSIRRFIRAETTVNGIDVWLGIELQNSVPLPGDLLCDLQEMVTNVQHLPLLDIAKQLESDVGMFWPGRHFFIEVGYKGMQYTIQVYGSHE